MPILFSDNFDGEAEGTSPPANIVNDATYPANSCEVDDVQAHSSPHSMWVKKNGSGVGWCHRDYGPGFTNEPYVVWYYFENTTQQRHLITNKATGNHVGTNILANVQFQTDADIVYYDGAYQDTGYNYATGWHKFEIIHDCPNDQFDMWYDDVEIITAGNFRNTGSSVKSLHFQVDAGTGTCQLWVDDIQVGEAAAGWTGKVIGTSNPAKIIGTTKDTVNKVDGVVSA